MGEHNTLGKLMGNQFCLVVRNVNDQEDQLNDTTIKEFKNQGFINYFGLQRFGLTSPTALIGLAIIRSQFKMAVDLILYNFNCQCNSLIKQAKEKYTTDNDPKAAYQILYDKRKKGLESIILKGCTESSLDSETEYLKILNNLPRNFKTLFIHGYQSWIFNKMVNFRLSLNRNSLILGDLIYISNSEKIEEDKIITIQTDEDLIKYKDNFHNLILPIVGYNVKIPKNCEDFLSNIFTEHDISMDNFNHSIKDFKLAGTYRPVFVNFEDDKNFEFDFLESISKDGATSDLQDKLGNWIDVEKG